MDIDAIHVFVKVVEAGSFSRAAELLKMPKTTVSAKVAALEKRLNVTLIQRTTRKLHVTPAGETYFRYCAKAIQEIEMGESELLASNEAPRGLLKVTAPADMGHSLLPRIVREYLKLYPQAEVELIVTNRIVDLVGEGVDLAIRAGELKDSTMISKKFFENRAGFWATPQYVKRQGEPSHPRDLHQRDLILHSNLKTSQIELTDGRSQVVLNPKPRLKADDFETIKSLVLLDEGVGWIPEFLVIREIREKKLRPLLPNWKMKSSESVSFVYPGQKYASPKVKAFMDVAIQFKNEFHF